MNNNWIFAHKTYNKEKRASIEPVFTLGNGYMCCRGFFDEEQSGILSLGGIYMAGIFGPARYTPWKGKGRELVNTPNFYSTKIFADNEAVIADEGKVSDFQIQLDMKTPKLNRSYIWTGSNGNKLRLEFERFISGSDLHTAGQKISITPIGCSPKIRIEVGINADVTNLNLVSSEPLPVQPGVKHLNLVYRDSNCILTEIHGYEDIAIAEGQKVYFKTPQNAEGLIHSTDMNCRHIFEYRGIENQSCEIEKIIYVYTSKDGEKDPLSKVKKLLEEEVSYQEKLDEHKAIWDKKWEVSDIVVEGSEEDQISIRYNILQLIQSCPEHNSKLSIGARGLTGEMYEGCIFWDTEIFMLPFFTFTNPKAAQNLLKFRYHTLPEARKHAERNWFKGAMYPWQASEKGIEQTPFGVGAYYSIHIVADIAYSIMEYWNATHDEEFITEAGAEILLETARFWESRVHKNPFSGKYDILAVRGPNEYGGIVNNNLYTNMMAQQNLILAKTLIQLMKEKYPAEWERLKDKVSFSEEEISKWDDIIENITICYNAELDLYEEDDMYLSRVPLDMKKAKPTSKRIIDSTIPYEALMLYQVTKQADVLHLMKNLHWRFTHQQKVNAWKYYVPKTCFDSSLAFSIHAVMAAQIGLQEEAYNYFKVCANFDIRNVLLNTVSGLHFANFGGTWQAVVFGFAGLQVDEYHLKISPNLPRAWKSISFHIWYRGNLLKIYVSQKSTEVYLKHTNGKDICLKVSDTEFILNESNNHIKLSINGDE